MSLTLKDKNQLLKNVMVKKFMDRNGVYKKKFSDGVVEGYFITRDSINECLENDINLTGGDVQFLKEYYDTYLSTFHYNKFDENEIDEPYTSNLKNGYKYRGLQIEGLWKSIKQDKKRIKDIMYKMNLIKHELEKDSIDEKIKKKLNTEK